MTLIATQKFTDKQGQTHEKDQRFNVASEQEAQELIRNGQARKEEQSGQESSRSAR